MQHTLTHTLKHTLKHTLIFSAPGLHRSSVFAKPRVLAPRAALRKFAVAHTKFPQVVAGRVPEKPPGDPPGDPAGAKTSRTH